MTVPMAAREAAERRDAARALLRRPVLTAPGDADALALIRRHASGLRTTFGTLLGYPLVVETGFARLIKAPLTPDAPSRPAVRSSGGEFTARTYTLLALLCAALLAPDAGDQLLVSSLVAQVRADAAGAGIELEDSTATQRHLVAAFRLLTEWGVVEETQGSMAAWGERREEALLTVRRSMLPHLLARPLAVVETLDALLTSAPDATDQPRRSLRRKLVENPLVRREALSDAERDVLSRERTELSRQLDDAFGLIIEVRAEGALAYDPDRELTDIEFPASGTIKQAALLTVDHLLRENEPAAGTTATVDGTTVPGLTCQWSTIEDVVATLAMRHQRSWAADLAGDPARLGKEVAALLVAVGLAARTPDGLVLHPAAARHRPSLSESHRSSTNEDLAPTLFDVELS